MMARLLHLRRARRRDRSAELLDRVRPRRRAPPPGEDLLGRHAPPPRPGGQHDRPAGAALPRRADDRPRPAQPGAAVGRRQGPGRRRRDGAAHHPVPRRGRPARRQDRRAAPRPDRRRGHAPTSSSRAWRGGRAAAVRRPAGYLRALPRTSPRSVPTSGCAPSRSAPTAPPPRCMTCSACCAPRARPRRGCRSSGPASTTCSCPSPHQQTDQTDPERPESEHPMTAAYALSDTSVMIARCLRRSLRDPEAFITALMLPVILMLLFVYVFGGAFNAGGGAAVRQLRGPRPDRAVRRLRRGHHRGRGRHRHEQRHRRPVPLDADPRLVGAGRAHRRQPGAQPARDRAGDRRRPRRRLAPGRRARPRGPPRSP